jgi:hypothetical protein
MPCCSENGKLYNRENARYILFLVSKLSFRESLFENPACAAAVILQDVGEDEDRGLF